MINLKQKIKTFEGKPVNLSDGKNKTELTLKSVLITALTAQYQEEKIEGEEMIKRYELAKAVHKKDKIEMTSEEKVTAKELVGKMYGTLIYGIVNEILEK